MSLFRKAVNRSVSQVSARTLNAPMKQVSRRNFATILESREQGEEAKYIRQQENENKAKRIQEIERLLALDANNKERQEFLEKLAGSGKVSGQAAVVPTKPDGLLAKMGLDDWKFAVPVGIFLAVPALNNELIVLNEETQMIGCFGLFLATMYTQVGPLVSAAFAEYAETQDKLIQNAEAAAGQGLQSSINVNRELLTLGEDFTNLEEYVDAVKKVQVEAVANKAIFDHHAAITQQLETLVTLEENAVQALRTRMIKSVKANALETLTNDKKVKEATLARAIEYLAGGAKGPLGKDIVGEVFVQSLSNYRENYTKQAAGSDPIIKQLEVEAEKLVAPKAAAAPAAKHH